MMLNNLVAVRPVGGSHAARQVRCASGAFRLVCLVALVGYSTACNSEQSEPAPLERDPAPVMGAPSMKTMPTVPGAPAAGGAAPATPQATPPTGNAFGTEVTGGVAMPGGSAGMQPMQAVVPPAPDKAEPCNVVGCPVGLECAPNGICRTPPPACLADGDCGADERCGLTGECLAPGGCRVPQDCAEAEACRDQVCTLGSDCGQTELVIDPVVPNVLMLIDVSASMDEQPNGAPCFAVPGCNSKMRIADSAMLQMTTTYRGKIRWGLATFSGDAACAAPADVIAPGDGNEDMVTTRIASTIPAGFTPINASITAIQAATYLKDPDHPNYLLFISDGAETCAEMMNEDTRQRIVDMHGAGIGTFVVGFGSGVDVNWLNQFAEAGGYPNPSGTPDPVTMTPRVFYAADNAAGLEQALGSILETVVGCDYTLMGPPEDPSAVWAFLDDVMVERDSPDGWRLDTATNTVSFTGEACARLQSGEARDIDIVFGCPEPVLE